MISYYDLDKSFTKPKVKYLHKKLPRKLKKKINKIIIDKSLFTILDEKDLNVKMWYLNWFINPDYNRFLIKKTCENPNSGKWLKK